MLRSTRPLYAAALQATKASTSLTGIPPHPNPLPTLTKTYNQTLNLLSNLPATSVYRQSTEAVTKHNLSLVEQAGGDVKVAEKSFGKMLEIVVMDARNEVGLAGKMIEWKAWEPLVEEAEPNQWRYFDPGDE